MLRHVTHALLLCTLVASADAEETRKQWTNTRLIGSPEPPSAMVAVPAYPKLPVKRPVFVDREPGTDRMVVIENYAWDENRAVLKRFVDKPDANELETLMTVSGDDELAYGICFHPRFAENGFFYLGCNGKGPGDQHHSRIVRYTMAREAPWRIVEGSAKTIIEWPSNGHNGAASAFGKDGMLYVTSGDGTPNSDSDNAGQETASMLSKVMRIDVDGAPAGQTYRVPEDNPFISNPAVRPETWAYGLRNPWRITCDLESGQIWVGQNGQDLREYANLLERGANYGWSAYEGSREFLPVRLRGPAPFTPPTIEHDHAAFRSLTGGFVYRGNRFPELRGAYLYGDYGTGRVWAAKHDGQQLLWNRELADTPLAIAGFGTNQAGDILLADHLGHAIAKLEVAPAVSDQKPFPHLLSETGLFSDTATLLPADGVIPYEINAPAWHDGASAERLLALPGDEAAELPPADDAAGGWKSWTLPDGTVLAQTLSFPAKESAPPHRIETRILLKQDADWSGYSFLWNAAQMDATLVEKEGRQLMINGQEWSVPSRAECVMCHARGANYALSLTEAQLNRDTPSGHQLAHFAALGITRPKDGRRSLTELPALVNPRDLTAPLDERAKAYFAVNCAHCHMKEGGGNSLMELSPWLPWADRHLLNAQPQHGDFGMRDGRIVSPGDAGHSVLLLRINMRGPGQMPPIGSVVPDLQGSNLIVQWLLDYRSH